MINKNKITKLLQLFHQENLSLEDDIIPKIINEKKVLKGIKFNKPFLDIGIPNDFQRAGFFLKK